MRPSSESARATEGDLLAELQLRALQHLQRVGFGAPHALREAVPLPAQLYQPSIRSEPSQALREVRADI